MRPLPFLQKGTLKCKLLFGVCLLGAGGGYSRASLTVTAGNIAEGNLVNALPEAVFQLNLTPVSATDSFWEYCTAADTAKEGEDYLPVRGVATIPAGQSQVSVRVPLIPDARPEADETFSLIVWAQGTFPVPALTEIAKPVSPPNFNWTAARCGLSGGYWFVGPEAGRIGNDVWSVNTITGSGNGIAAASGYGVAWLDRFHDTPGFENIPLLKVAAVERAGFLPWEPHIQRLLPNAGNLSMADDLLAYTSGNYVNFLRLFPLREPEPAGVVEVPTNPVSPPGFVGFDSRRLALSIFQEGSGEVRIFVRNKDNRLDWVLEKVIPDAAMPAVQQGDVLIARQASGGSAGPLRVFSKDHGGPGQWGLSTTIVLPAPAPLTINASLACVGGLLLVGDPGNLNSSPPGSSGKIHLFKQEATATGWTWQGSFPSPGSTPGDGFGVRAAQAGRHVLTFSDSPNKAWGGAFPGADVRIVNDDLPVLDVSAPPGFEPEGDNPSIMQGTFSLSHAPEVPVVIAWQLTAGTAQSGLDFSHQSGETVIPVGSRSATFNISLLPDQISEKDETLGLNITALTGAVASPETKEFVIRDTEKPAAYLRGDSAKAFESAPLATTQLRLFGNAPGISVPTAAILPGLGGPGYTAADYGVAVPGVDWPGLPQTLNFTPDGMATLPLPVNNDNTLDKHRQAAIGFTLPPGVAAASYSPRYMAGPTSVVTGIPFSQPSTDGTWTGVRKSADQSEALVYQRSGATGSWTEAGPLPPSLIGRTTWTGVQTLLQGGRFACYDHTQGQAWIVRLEENASPPWVLEAAIPGVPRFAFISRTLDFDGETLAIHSLLIERGDQDWKFRQSLETSDETTNSTLVLRLQRGLIFYYTWRANEPYAIRIATRSGPAWLPWQFTGSIPLNQAGFQGNLVNGFHLQDNLFVVGLNAGLPERTLIFRRNDAGSWMPEQTLADYPLSLVGGVLTTASQIYADIGAPPARWQQTGPITIYGGDVQYDFAEGVVVTTTSNPGTMTIWEPGLTFAILDRESIRISTNTPTLAEPASRETLAYIRVSVDQDLPLDVTVPFQSGSAGTALPGLDFRQVQGQVLIPAGVSGITLALPLLPDRLQESTETIQFSLGQPSYGTIHPNSTSKLLNLTDLALTKPLAPAQVFLPEPITGSAAYNVAFPLPAPSSAPLTVRYTTVARSASASDFTVVVNGSVQVPAGAASAAIPLTIQADALAEAVESLEIELSLFGTTALSPPLVATVYIEDAAAAPAVADTFSTAQNLTLPGIPSRNLLTNDPPPASVALPAHPSVNGTVQIQPDGTFQYSPLSNFIGTDYFAYHSATADSYFLPGPITWKWLNPANGADPESARPGFRTSWMQPSFDDSAWSSGTGQLGYGTLGAGAGLPPETEIGFPPAGARYTAYLRTSFNVPHPPAPGLSLTFSCDDAIILYLNGQPLGRYAAAPAGSFATAADVHQLLSPTAHDLWEETEIRSLSFPAAQLQQGVNVLAVSVHNNSNSSSDLSFQLHRLATGNVSALTFASIQVNDSASPPLISPDTYNVSGTDVPLSSYLIGGSLYWNDSLLSQAGTAYDSILEVETSGSPAGPVSVNAANGHFTMTPPRGFYGTTSFNYRVRDKDGWSAAVPVTLNISPARPWDVWRASNISSDSQSPLAAPAADPDGDGLPNALEFLMGRNPQIPGFEAPVELQWNGSGWTAESQLRTDQTREFFVTMESASSLNDPSWIEMLHIPPTEAAMANRVAPDVLLTTGTAGFFTRYNLSWPWRGEARNFIRLKASREYHPLNP